jgi:hypothetical protein
MLGFFVALTLAFIQKSVYLVNSKNITLKLDSTVIVVGTHLEKQTGMI